MILCMRLCKKSVYRLALYQVLSAIWSSFVWGIVLITIHVTDCLTAEGWPGRVVRFFLISSTMTQLMVTTWMVIHMFVITVLQKKLNKWLELLYVLSSIVLPLALAIICVWTESLNLTIPNLVVPLLIFLLTFVVLVPLPVIIGIALCCRIIRKKDEINMQHKIILCEMLPLILYPVMFIPLLAAFLISTLPYFLAISFG